MSWSKPFSPSDKAVKIVVPFPPGGAADMFARMVGQKLSEAWGAWTSANALPA